MKSLLIFFFNLTISLICISDQYDWVNNVIIQLIIFIKNYIFNYISLETPEV